ncbi:hypothetical protein DXG01_007741 [Tephrocybe rancida]|nr:hypothetical protein DXG01_007741 [Tephrocybe rancida]
MRPEERLLIQNVGSSILVSSLAQLPTICICYGIFAPVSIMAALGALRRRRRSALFKAQLVILPLAVVTLTGNLILQMRAAVLYYDFFRSHVPSLSERAYSVNIVLAKVNIALYWLQFIPPVLNDAFIIWRAWLVFERRRWALYLSVLLCLSSLVMTLVYLALLSSPTKLLAQSFFGGGIQWWLSLSNSILVFITNFVSTCFIGWTLWFAALCLVPTH